MQACAHSSSMNIFIERIAPLHRRFWPSGLHSPNGDRLENTFASGAAAQRASLRSEKVANRRGAVQRVPSPPQAPLTLSRPAAGAAHGVDDARASDLPGSANRDQLCELMRWQGAQRSSRQQ